MIGRVRVWSPHTALSEQTNRQGLIDSDAASALRTLMMWVLHVELRNLINEVDQAEQVSKRQAEEKALAFRDTQHEVEQAVVELRAKLDPSARPLVDRVTRGVNTLAEQCASLVGRVDAAVKEVADEREKFVYLAGIGLMSGVTDVHEDAARELAELLQPKKQIDFLEKLCRGGQQDGEFAFGVLTTLSPEQSWKKAPWCQILVEFHAAEDADSKDGADDDDPADELVLDTFAALASGFSDEAEQPPR